MTETGEAEDGEILEEGGGNGERGMGGEMEQSDSNCRASYDL